MPSSDRRLTHNSAASGLGTRFLKHEFKNFKESEKKIKKEVEVSHPKNEKLQIQTYLTISICLLCFSLPVH
jgi:hypothetical protein